MQSLRGGRRASEASPVVAQPDVGKSSGTCGDKGNHGRRLTQAERVAQSDKRMFSAAISLIDEVGTHNTTLKEISERAGYSRGLASNRFGSKEALFFELLKRYNEVWKEQLASAVSERKGLEAFVAANQRLISFFRREVKFVRVMYTIWFEMVGSSEAMREMLRVQHTAYLKGTARWIREGMADGTVRTDVNPEQLAMLYISGVFGMVYQWLTNPDEVDMTKVLTGLGENILTIAQN